MQYIQNKREIFFKGAFTYLNEMNNYERRAMIFSVKW